MGTEALILSDCYCTPCWLARRVGRFDTDPCSNNRTNIEALAAYMLERGQDGLYLPWPGRVWMNHPYSDPMPWMRKLQYERAIMRCTESLVLAKLDTSTQWWEELTSPQYGRCDLWVFKRRINFEIPPEILAELQLRHEAKCRAAGKKLTQASTSNNFCSVLVHHRYGINGHVVYKPLELHDVAQLWNRASPSAVASV